MRSTYIRSCGLIFSLTALIKCVTLLIGGELLNRTDELLGMQFRTVILASGAFEVGASLLCFLRPRTWVTPLILATMGAEFLLYRVSNKLLGVQKMCPCLGYFTQWLGLNQQMTDWLLGGISLYLFLGGSLILMREARSEE